MTSSTERKLDLRELEKEAERIIEDANKKSEAILHEAKDKADAIILSAGNENMAQIQHEITREAEKRSREIVTTEKQTVKDLEERANRNLEKAVEKIVRAVVGV